MTGRFEVQTVSGWRIGAPDARAKHTSTPEGLSAHVCDTIRAHHVVASYRSEDRDRRPGRQGYNLGRDGALAAAEDHARYLNRLYGAA